MKRLILGIIVVLITTTTIGCKNKVMKDSVLIKETKKDTVIYKNVNRSTNSSTNSTYVKGYYRKNGTYVKGHYRKKK